MKLRIAQTLLLLGICLLRIGVTAQQQEKRKQDNVRSQSPATGRPADLSAKKMVEWNETGYLPVKQNHE